MSVRVIQGTNGKPKGVYIPINDWETMKEQYSNLQVWEEPEPTKEEILDDIRKSVEEVKLIKAGKLKAKTLDELLEELN